MVRPCYIVVDPEHSGSISTRKLVIESAKFNVITAYSGTEAIETVARFPAVDGIVCNSELRDMPVPDLVSAVKQQNPRMPFIIVGPLYLPGEADFHVPSFDPENLLQILKQLDAFRAIAIGKHEEVLREKEDG
jgi:DNA-binding NtrC family response regulator